MKNKLIAICFALICAVIGLAGVIRLRPRPVDLEGIPIQGETLELVGLADTREEAEAIAADYGITLLSYNKKVAVFMTDKSYEEITEIGKNKGLTELSINHKVEAY